MCLGLVSAGMPSFLTPPQTISSSRISCATPGFRNRRKSGSITAMTSALNASKPSNGAISGCACCHSIHSFHDLPGASPVRPASVRSIQPSSSTNCSTWIRPGTTSGLSRPRRIMRNCWRITGSGISVCRTSSATCSGGICGFAGLGRACASRRSGIRQAASKAPKRRQACTDRSPSCRRLERRPPRLDVGR